MTQLINLILKFSQFLTEQPEMTNDVENGNEIPQRHRERVSQLHTFKKPLYEEKELIEKAMNNDEPFRYTMQDQNLKPGMEKRKVEIDVVLEAIDDVIDIKNAHITDHQYRKVFTSFLKVCIDKGYIKVPHFISYRCLC